MVETELISFYETVLRSDAEDIDARVRLGWLCYDEHPYHDAAVWHLQLALSKEPRSAEAGFWLAKVFFHGGCQFELAQTALEQVLKYHADHVPSLSLLASVYCDLDQPKRAVELLQRSLELAPSWVSLHESADNVYFGLREFTLAKKHAKEAGRLADEFHRVSTPGTYSYFEQAITGRWVDSETVARLNNRALHAR